LSNIFFFISFLKEVLEFTHRHRIQSKAPLQTAYWDVRTCLFACDNF